MRELGAIMLEIGCEERERENVREFGSTYLTAGKAISSVYVSPPVCWRPWRPVSASSSSSLEIGVNVHKHI